MSSTNVPVAASPPANAPAMINQSNHAGMDS
jgi:hypothetical protein